jgi:hypothetical protein
MSWGLRSVDDLKRWLRASSDNGELTSYFLRLCTAGRLDGCRGVGRLDSAEMRPLRGHRSVLASQARPGCSFASSRFYGSRRLVSLGCGVVAMPYPCRALPPCAHSHQHQEYL